VSANVIPTRAPQLAIKGLVVVACNYDTVSLGQQVDYRSLHTVEILKLVNKNKFICGHERGVGRKLLVCAMDTIVEVNGIIVIRPRPVESVVFTRTIQIAHHFDEFGSI
jgi:hypothetical protein